MMDMIASSNSQMVCGLCEWCWLKGGDVVDMPSGLFYYRKHVLWGVVAYSPLQSL